MIPRLFHFRYGRPMPSASVSLSSRSSQLLLLPMLLLCCCHMECPLDIHPPTVPRRSLSLLLLHLLRLVLLLQL